MAINNSQITIDGTAILTPTNISVNWEQVDLDSGRNAQGLMIRNLKRFRVYTITISYDNRSIEGIKFFSDQIMNKTFFNVSFYSPYENRRITIPMYFGGSSTTVKNYVIDVEPNKNGWLESTTFELIQQ